MVMFRRLDVWVMIALALMLMVDKGGDEPRKVDHFVEARP
jgi:hypothetical protein